MLDRLLSGLIKNATGIDARKVVRKVGAKNILMMGGAALAGGALLQQRQQAGGGQTPMGAGAPSAPPQPPHAPPPYAPASPPTTVAEPPPPHAVPPPPPPPIPGAAPPPVPVPTAPGAIPPPPVPAAAETDDDPPPALTYAIVRTLVAGAMADGRLDDDERALIQDNLNDSNLSTEQVAQVHQDMADAPSPATLAGLVSADAERALLYRFGAVVVMADGEASPMEIGWLGRLAEALNLDAATRAQLDQEILGTVSS